MTRAVIVFLLLTVTLWGCLARGRQLQNIEQLLKDLTHSVGALSNSCAGGDLIDVGAGYYMAFRAQPGINKPVYERFVDKGNNDDDDAIVFNNVPCGCKTTDGRLPCDRHYRSKLLDLWDRLPIDKVRVGVYKDNKEQRFLEFNGQDTDFKNWFSQKNLIADSYTDLTSTNPQTNYFSVEGQQRNVVKRTLFANKHYGGCPRDSGWLVVVDWPYCGWEKAEPSALPRIIYSKVDTVTNWNTAENVGYADVLVVSVKLKGGNSSCLVAKS